MMRKRHLVFFILPLLIFVLWQTGCKKNSLTDNEAVYDIRGEWTITNYRTGGFTSIIKCTFSGNLESGTVTPESGEPGMYYVGMEHRYPVEFHFVVVEMEPELMPEKESKVAILFLGIPMQSKSYQPFTGFYQVFFSKKVVEKC